MVNEGGPETGEQIHIHIVYNWSECVFLEKFVVGPFVLFIYFFSPASHWTLKQ